MNIKSIRKEFAERYRDGDFVTDRTGAKTIEILGASFLADRDAIFGEPNMDYIKKEVMWYMEESTNVNDIYGAEREAPAAWKYAANAHGEINSNYGKLIYSDLYYNQFLCAQMELVQNPDSRRATMVYTRPSIWVEATDAGKNDFICTNAVTYYIRNGFLSAVVQMRSNDIIFGYRNDFAWQKIVLEQMVVKLNQFGMNLQVGGIRWQVQNLHIYERHFYMLDHFIKTGEHNISKAKYDELYGA